jgi:hypothetical protein
MAFGNNPIFSMKFIYSHDPKPATSAPVAKSKNVLNLTFSPPLLFRLTGSLHDRLLLRLTTLIGTFLSPNVKCTNSFKAPEVRAIKQINHIMDAYAQHTKYKITVKDTEGSSVSQSQYNYCDLDTVSQSQLSPLTVFSL